MKRILALILVLVMLSSTLMSCKKDEQNNPDGNSGTVSTDEGVEAPPYDAAIDSLDFEEREITLMVTNATDLERYEFYRESELDDGDAVNLAVHQRNLGVEEKLNVKLDFMGVAGTQITDEVTKYVASGDSTVDIYALLQSSCLALATQGAYLNLLNVPYLNTDSSWWNSTWNEATEFNNARYTIVGNTNTTVVQKTMCCFVNMDILKEQFPTNTPDLYSVVNNGEWTLEYVQTLVKNVYEDNGTVAGVPDKDDTFGITVANISQPAQALLTSMGFNYTVKDASGNVSLALVTENNIDIMEKIHDFFKPDKEGIYRPEEWPAVYEYANLFAKGRQMMAMSPMFTAERLTATDIDYIVLPMPKNDVTQDGYRSSSQDSHTFCSISSASDSAEHSAAVLEYMGYLSKKDLTPKYYDVIYKIRYASNKDTMALFDMIINNIVFDFAICWTSSLNRIMHNVRGLAADSSKGITSGLTSIENVTKGYLENLMTELNK